MNAVNVVLATFPHSQTSTMLWKASHAQVWSRLGTRNSSTIWYSLNGEWINREPESGGLCSMSYLSKILPFYPFHFPRHVRLLCLLFTLYYVMLYISIVVIPHVVHEANTSFLPSLVYLVSLGY